MNRCAPDVPSRFPGGGTFRCCLLALSTMRCRISLPTGAASLIYKPDLLPSGPGDSKQTWAITTRGCSRPCLFAQVQIAGRKIYQAMKAQYTGEGIDLLSLCTGNKFNRLQHLKSVPYSSGLLKKKWPNTDTTFGRRIDRPG